MATAFAASISTRQLLPEFTERQRRERWRLRQLRQRHSPGGWNRHLVMDRPGAQRDSGFRLRVDVATRVAMLPNRKPRGLSVSEVG